MTHAEAWLRRIHAEARQAQEDPKRDAAFQAWKREHEAQKKKHRGGALKMPIRRDNDDVAPPPSEPRMVGSTS